MDGHSAINTPRFTFHPAMIEGVWRIERSASADDRGFFSRLYCADEFSAIGLDMPLAQINHSFSRQKGTIRGLHFQHPPHTETKIVSCLSGRIYDVALDLRMGSPTYLQWFGVELNAENRQSLVIPPGVAHGFQTLSDDSEIIYLVTTPYSPEFEDGVNPFDSAARIVWPLPVAEISQRDSQRAFLDMASFKGLVLDRRDG